MGFMEFLEREMPDVKKNLDKRFKKIAKREKSFVTRRDFERTNLGERIRREVIERDLSMPWCETTALLRRDYLGRIRIKIIEGEMESLAQHLYEVVEDEDYANARLIKGEVSRGLNKRKERYEECKRESGKQINLEIITLLESIENPDPRSERFKVEGRKVLERLARCTFYATQGYYITMHTHRRGTPPSDLDREILPGRQSLVVSYVNPDEFYVYSVTHDKEEIIWP